MPAPPLVVAHLDAWFPVGIVRWSLDGVPRLTVMAKLTFDLADDGTVTVAGPQEPLRAAGEGPAAHPGDFVPRKAGVDLLVTGSARAAAPSSWIEASVTIRRARALGAAVDVDGFRRSWLAGARDPVVEIPLAPPHLYEADGRAPSPPAGAVPPALPEPEPGGADAWPHDGDFDFAVYQLAAPPQRLAALPDDARIELAGFWSDPGARVVALPLRPRVLVDRGFGDDGELALACDTLSLDLDARRVVAVWRGEIAVDDASVTGLDRLVATASPPGAAADPAALRRRVARARLSLAHERGREPDPSDDDVLALARFEAMEHAAEPSLDVATFAAISAALAEGRPPRAEVLARHGLTEDAWSIEERAHGERMADDAAVGDVSLAAEFGEAFVAAQDRLADPGEAAWTVARYAELTAALEAAQDPEKALRARGLTTASFLRVDRRLGAIVASDPAARAEFEVEVARARAEIPPEPDDDEGDGGEEEPA